MTGKSTRSSLGIADVSWREGYKIVRPLLNVSKQYIHQYQTQYQVPFYEDETNHQNDYVRNDIRNRILPAIEQNAQLDAQQLLKLKTWHDEQLLHLQKGLKHFYKLAVTMI